MTSGGTGRLLIQPQDIGARRSDCAMAYVAAAVFADSPAINQKASPRV
jgi:hypothetical protein